MKVNWKSRKFWGFWLLIVIATVLTLFGFSLDKGLGNLMTDMYLLYVGGNSVAKIVAGIRERSGKKNDKKDA